MDEWKVSKTNHAPLSSFSFEPYSNVIEVTIIEIDKFFMCRRMLFD